MSDQTEALLARVQSALEADQKLVIEGGGSTRALRGRRSAGTPIAVSGHLGVVAHHPAELVVSVRAGTPVAQLQAQLAEAGQHLACDPPQRQGRATVGGALAGNLSGPARPWLGALRDAVLGVELINGRGELLKFGGVVMKNVAGYDLSRLQAGALGTLGLVTGVNFKVMPLPEHSLTLAFACSATEALAEMNRRAREGAPLAGACWWQGTLYLRLAGAASAVSACARTWGGTELADGEPWEALREYAAPLFPADLPWWRLSISPAAPLLGEPWLLDWGGTLRWYASDPQGDLAAQAQALGGYLGQWNRGDSDLETSPDLPAPERDMHRRIKSALDPCGLFNPGRLYSWM